MRHMSDLQASVVSDMDAKAQINNQIMQYEENLERLHCEQFRLRCYMASLQSGELPNPKVIFYHLGSKSPVLSLNSNSFKNSDLCFLVTNDFNELYFR